MLRSVAAILVAMIPDFPAPVTYTWPFDEAITSYKDAARVQPNEPEAYYNLGLAYLEIGDRDSVVIQARRLESIDAELSKKLLAELHR